MKAYLDANVLVAASVESHPHDVPAFDLVKGDAKDFRASGLADHGAQIAAL